MSKMTMVLGQFIEYPLSDELKGLISDLELGLGVIRRDMGRDDFEFMKKKIARALVCCLNEGVKIGESPLC